MAESDPPRLVALRYRDYRLLWAGLLVSITGSQMQLIAVNWHIFTLLEGQTLTLELFGRSVSLGAEALGLGSLGLVRIVPIILFALLGGMLADTFDRRRLLILTQAAAALFAASLAAFSLAGSATLGLIYLLTAADSAANALSNPSRQSLVPNLVATEHLTNALSLSNVGWQLGTVIGPAIAGLLVGRFDVGVVYAVNALSFAAVIVALWLMRYRPAARGPASGLGWRALVEGLRFTFSTRIILGTMLLDFFATLFSSARTMLPLIASDVLGLGARGYGLLATAEPAGAVLTGAILSLRRDIRHQGRVLLLAVAVYGLATALFGISSQFGLSYMLYGLVGAGDTVSTVIRNTLRQLNTPDRLRGRMTGVNMIFFMGGPQLGELEAGLVASAFGVPFAIFSGGILTVLMTLWVAWRFPRLRRYVNPTSVKNAQTVPLTS
ncbi:MAG: MFS transporter [Candidatus Promineifilaceae bacterium]